VVIVRPETTRVLRVVAVAVYVGVFVALVLPEDHFGLGRGLPVDREQIFLWLAGLLILLTIGRPQGGLLRVVRDWLPIALVLVLYDLTRGRADDWLGITAHVRPQLVADQWLGWGEVPTVRLQDAIFGADGPGPVATWEAIITLTYISHFFVPFGVAAVFWVRDRARYWRYVRRFVTLSFLGALTFILFPAVPPWLAAQMGELDPVHRTVTRGFAVLDLEVASRVLQQGQRTVNLVAAIPSLHAGYTALVGWALWPSFRRVGRTVLLLYPLLMAFTLVVSGEHYLVDIFIGWAYAAVVIVVWDRIEKKRPDRIWPWPRAARSPSPSSSPSTPVPGPTAERSPTVTSA
jgi:membrane-associated phospholipid phosphatase